MTEILSRFSLHSAKFGVQVWLCLAVVWLTLLACAITSIYAQPFSARQQKFWLCAVVFVPLFGLLAYLPFSFRRDQIAQFFFLRSPKNRNTKQNESPASSRFTGGRKT